MSNHLMHFDFNGNDVRLVMRDGEPWWVAWDVCRALGIGNTADALGRLDDEEWDTLVLNDGTPGNPAKSVVNEPGLYNLVLGSRKPEAKAFKRWVTHEVLPQIRKTGTYSVAPVYQIPQTYAEALRLAADLSETVEAQKQTIALMEPKADFYDTVAVAENCQDVGSVARVLGIGRNTFFKWMREQGILMWNNQPYQRYLDEGYFQVIEQVWTDSQGKSGTDTKTLVTGKGLLWLQKRYRQGA